MKTFILSLFLLLSFSLFSQIDCIDFGAYSDDYVNEVGFNDEDYPAGTTFMEEGFLQIVKAEGLTEYLSTGSDEFTFIGNVDIDVSELICPHKVLTFSLAVLGGGSTWINVDGEEVGDMAEPFPLYYEGDGWVCEYDGANDITITGNFDLVNLYGSTNILSDCCLECTEGPEENCIDFGDYTTPYVDTVGWDDETYPPGSVFMENGDIKIIKPDGETNYLSVSGDGFAFVGDIDINISSSECENRVLTLNPSPDIMNGISVDGEIISDEGDPWPPSYDGGTFNYVFDLDTYSVIISGLFNEVSLFGSTQFVSMICLECDTTEFETDCINYNDYSDDFVNEVGWNDTDYPAGTTFMENGTLHLVKPDGETNYLSVDGDGFAFVGDVDINVADSDCEVKVLTFGIIPDPSNAISIDGEVISDEGDDWPAEFEGDGFTFEMDDDGNVIVTGDFDVVSLYGSTNILSNVCLECGEVETDGISELNASTEFSIYPNPTYGNPTIKLENTVVENYQLQVISISGQVLSTEQINGTSLSNGYQLNVEHFEGGIYFVSLSNAGYTSTVKLIINN
jgi:hypothetical protein